MTRRTHSPSLSSSTDQPAAERSALGPRPFTRREFLAASGAGLGLAAVPRLASALSATSVTRVMNSSISPQPLGVQLYTLRDMVESNFEYALREVAAVGYKEVEFAGLFGNDPKKAAKLLSKFGLTAPSSHIGLDRLTAKLPGVVDEAQALGNEFVVCPSIEGPPLKSADDWRRVAEQFNRLGDSLQRVGLKFAFHNHDREFAPLPSGETGYDILLAECDPRFVKMELDLYWIAKAGRDPLTYFEKYPRRFPLVHVKDMGAAGAMANVGQGRIDWPKIFAKRRDAGIEHFFVENDNARSPIDDIRISYAYLSRMDL